MTMPPQVKFVGYKAILISTIVDDLEYDEPRR